MAHLDFGDPNDISYEKVSTIRRFAALEERLFKEIKIPPLIESKYIAPLESLNSVRISIPVSDDFSTAMMELIKTVEVHVSDGGPLLFKIYITYFTMNEEASFSDPKGESIIGTSFSRSTQTMKVTLTQDQTLVGKLKVGNDDILISGPTGYVDLRVLKRKQGTQVVDRYVLEVDNTRIGRITGNHVFFSHFCLPFQKLLIICAWLLLFGGKDGEEILKDEQLRKKKKKEQEKGANKQLRATKSGKNIPIAPPPPGVPYGYAPPEAGYDPALLAAAGFGFGAQENEVDPATYAYANPDPYAVQQPVGQPKASK